MGSFGNAAGLGLYPTKNLSAIGTVGSWSRQMRASLTGFTRSPTTGSGAVTPRIYAQSTQRVALPAPVPARSARPE
jgi:hypothetical protein